MTLIASFEYQHTPILVGDLLITSKGAPTREAATPLIHEPNKIVGKEGTRSIVSLRQKLAILHEHICLAWTGDLFYAERFAEHIRSFSLGKASIGYDDLRAVILAYPREDLENHLDFIVYSWHGTGWGYFSNLKPFDLDLQILSQMRVGGSGTAHFIRHFETAAKALPLTGSLDEYTLLGTRALLYASLASAQQFFEGVGLTEWWGGGFEVVVFRDGRLAKLGPICWLYWECAEIASEHFSLRLKSEFMYQYYIDDTAMFWIDEGSQGKIHSISPPFRTTDQPLQRPKIFDTDIVVNLVRVEMLDGDNYCGGSVDTSAGINSRDLTITWLDSEDKTTLGIREAFIERMLRSMPLPVGSSVDVNFWGNALQFRQRQD